MTTVSCDGLNELLAWEGKVETSATFKTEWGRNMERSAGKYKMAKGAEAKPASNMNIAIQIWQCKFLHFILHGKSQWCWIKWSWQRGTLHMWRLQCWSPPRETIAQLDVHVFCVGLCLIKRRLKVDSIPSWLCSCTPRNLQTRPVVPTVKVVFYAAWIIYGASQKPRRRSADQLWKTVLRTLKRVLKYLSRLLIY